MLGQPFLFFLCSVPWKGNGRDIVSLPIGFFLTFQLAASNSEPEPAVEVQFSCLLAFAEFKRKKAPSLPPVWPQLSPCAQLPHSYNCWQIQGWVRKAQATFQ